MAARRRPQRAERRARDPVLRRAWCGRVVRRRERPRHQERADDRRFRRRGARRPSYGKSRMSIPPNSYRSGPDAKGHFGGYGGRFVAETLMPLVLDLERAYEAAKD